MTMGERIDLVRTEAGCSQKEFAEKIGLSESSISRVLTDKQGIGNSAKRLLCEKFSINPGWLETGEGDMYQIGEISEELEGVLKGYPAVLRALRMAVGRMTANDWQRLNDFIESLGGAE